MSKRSSIAPMGRAWLIELASEPPSAVGVTCGSERSGERWSLPVLVKYARQHGPGLGELGIDAARGVLNAPELHGKILRRAAVLRRERPEPQPQPKGLTAEAKGTITKRLNGHDSRDGGEVPAVPVTLPTCFFSSRPEIPPTDRERFGADFKPPVPVMQPHRRNDDEIVLEGEAALRRIRGSAPVQDWLKIGRALLVLRKRAMKEVGAKKPRGLPYVTRNSALLRQHGFMAISRSARQTAMLVVENLPAIEAWLETLPDERRLGLNHPMVGVARLFGGPAQAQQSHQRRRVA